MAIMFTECIKVYAEWRHQWPGIVRLFRSRKTTVWKVKRNVLHGSDLMLFILSLAHLNCYLHQSSLIIITPNSSCLATLSETSSLQCEIL